MAVSAPVRSPMWGAAGAILGALARDWFLFFQSNFAVKYSQVLTPSAASFTVKHGLGSLAVVVQVFNSAGLQLSPASVTLTDENTAVIILSGASTGRVVVIG